MTRVLMAMLMAAVFAGTWTAASAQTAPAAPGVIAPRPAAPGGIAPLGQPSQMPALSFDEIVGDHVQHQSINVGAVALGAVIGVVTFNVVSSNFFPLSMAAGGPLAGTLIADSALAASRIYAVSSAVVGGYLGHWLAGR